MSTSKEYIRYILDCMCDLDGITCRSMMSEYIVYYRGKIAAYICDNRLLLKPVSPVLKLLPNAKLQPPYEGAKNMVLFPDPDNQSLLKKVLEEMYDFLPERKK